MMRAVRGRYLVQFALVLIAFYGAAWAGVLSLPGHQNVSLIWPANGIALAAIMLGGYRLWPAILLGYAAFILVYHQSMALMVLGSSGPVVSALFGAWAMRRWWGVRDAIDSPRDVFGFILFGAGAASMLSASIGTAALAIASPEHREAWSTVWSEWWFGDAMGVLLVAPAILAWARFRLPSEGSVRLQTVEAFAAGALLTAVAAVAYLGPFDLDQYEHHLAYAPIPILIWLTVRFGLRGATGGVLFLSAIAVWGTAIGEGAFSEQGIASAITMLWTFIAITAMTFLTLGAAVEDRRRSARGLGEREETCRRIVDTAHEGIWTIDTEARTTLVNRRMAEMVGYDVEEMIGRSIYDFMDVEARTESRRQLEMRMMGYAEQREARLRHRNGSDVWVRLAASPLKDGEGRVVGALAMANDITTRKRVEDALRELARHAPTENDESFFEALLRGLTRALDLDGAVLALMEDQRAPGARRILACRRGGVADEVPFDRDGSLCRAVLEAGSCLIEREAGAAHPDDPTVIEFGAEAAAGMTLRDSKGRTLGVLIGLKARPIDHPGPVESLLTMFGSRCAAELERVAHERALRQSEARLQLILETMIDGFWEWEIDSDQIRWSDRLYELLGYEPSAFRPRFGTVLEITHPDDRDRHERAVRHHLETGERYHVEIRLRRADGGYRWIHARGRALRDDDGRPYRMVGSVRDVTERRRAEDLLHLQQAVLSLIAIGRPIQEILIELCAQVERQLDGARCTIMRLNRSEGRLRYAAGLAAGEELIEALAASSSSDSKSNLNPDTDSNMNSQNGGPAGSAAPSSAFQCEQPVYIPDIRADERGRSWREAADHCAMRACWAHPVLNEEHDLLGVLAVSRSEPGEPDDYARRLLETASDLAGIALQRESTLADLRRSEERFARAFHASPDAVTITTIPEGRFVEVNEGLERITGYTVEEAMGSSTVNLGLWEAREERARFFDRLEREGTVRNFEWRCRTKSGAIRVCQTSADVTDFDGRPHLLAVTRDVTDRHEAEESLRRSRRELAQCNQMLQMVLDTIPVRVFWKDRELRYLGCNRNFANDAGLDDPTAIVGRDDFDMVWREQAERYRADDTAVIESGESRLAYEEPQRSPDGRLIWLRTSKTPFRDVDGRIIGVLGTYEDITERKRTEDELERTRSLLMAAVDQSPAGILIADAPDGRIRIANRAALGIRGPSETPLTDIPISLYPENWQCYEADGTPIPAEDLPLARAILEGVEIENRELIIRRAGGEDRWVLATAAPVFERDGNVMAGIVVFPDITERKHMEQVLQAERDLLNAILSTSVAAAVVLDREGRLTYANEQAQRVLGLEKSEILGRTYDDPRWRIKSADGSHMPENEFPFARVMRSGEPVFDIKHAFEWKNGERRILSINGAPLFGADHRIERVVFSMSDVTEQHRTEAALRESEERYRTLVEHAPEAIVVFDVDADHFTDANENACHLFGCSREELLGKTVWDVSPERQPDGRPSREAAREMVRRALEDNIPRFEWAHRDMNGREFLAEVRVVRLPSIDRRLVRGSITDITERKEAERRQQFIMDELDHRVKNNLAAVHALTTQTLSACASLDEFQEVFTGRIEALSRIHELLAASKWRGAGVGDLVGLVLKPSMFPGRHGIACDGPPVMLPARASGPVMMTLHELMTNSLKHGSLSRPEGRLEVRWSVEKPHRLVLEWREADGPAMNLPIEPGLGLRLIRGFIEHELGGTTTLEFNPEGLFCRLEVPLT